MTTDTGDEHLFCNGIDGETGGYALDPPPTIAEIAQVARQSLMIPGVPGPGASTRSPSDPRFAPILADLAEMGWGVIFAKNTSPEVRSALEPLLALRREQAGDLFKELTFDPATDSFRRWLSRHDLAPGHFDESKVPFYLLIVGDPSAIPFEFQYLLDIDHAVGRLDLHSPADYASYTRSLLAYEHAAEPLQEREVVLWGPRQDPATELSADMLLGPLASEGGPPEPSREGRRGTRRGRSPSFRVTTHVHAGGTKANLLQTLHRGPDRRPPAMLFTASHGVCWPKGHPRQARAQGALLCQDWPIGSPIRLEHCFLADDVGANARLHGLVVFFFGCFTAGTPHKDNFLLPGAGPPSSLAERPFVSPLPRRLLSHPGGGALAAIGHIDRAWRYSIKPADTSAQIQPFRASLHAIMSGLPVGLATTDFSRRYATLSSHLLGIVDERRRGATSDPTGISDEELASAFIERNDAQGYVLLGDPAARLRPELFS